MGIPEDEVEDIMCDADVDNSGEMEFEEFVTVSTNLFQMAHQSHVRFIVP